jgi:hypothetical protein
VVCGGSDVEGGVALGGPFKPSKPALLAVAGAESPAIPLHPAYLRSFAGVSYRRPP